MKMKNAIGVFVYAGFISLYGWVMFGLGHAHGRVSEYLENKEQLDASVDNLQKTITEKEES